MGTFVDDVFDKHHKAKVPRAVREKSFQDTLLKDNDLKRYAKRKFNEIQQTKQSGGKQQYQARKRRGKTSARF